MRNRLAAPLAISLASIVSLAPPPARAAQVNFTVSVIDTAFPGTSLPTDVRAADLDGDGLLDIVVAAPDFGGSDDALLWYANEGNGTFTRTAIDLASWAPARFDVADLDGDLDQDLVVASGDSLHRYVNDGTGVFQRDRIDYQTAFRIPVIADLDGDEDMDVVASSNNAIFLEDNDGSGAFTSLLFEAAAIVDWGLAVADLDGDADRDVVAVLYTPPHHTVYWYRNDGGGFTRFEVGDTPNSTTDLVVDDYDRDGDLDIVAAEFETSTIVRYVNDGSETFARSSVSPDTTYYPNGVVVADLDRDVDRDVVAVGGNSALGEVMYYENSGASSFSRKPIDTDPGNRQRVAAADMDGDGDSDVLVVNSFPDQVVLYGNLGTGTGVVGGALAAAATRAVLDQNEPNPFRLRTEIRFALSEPGRAAIAVYTVAGERVRMLADGAFPAGAHAVSWDGRDGDGRSAPPGTYLYRLDVVGERVTRKMVLVR